MKRDMDMIRDLLLEIEGGRKMFQTVSNTEAEMLGIPDEAGLSREDAEKLQLHLELLEQQGLIEVAFKALGGTVVVKQITWSGHDFLDSVRDPEVWKKTKGGAAVAGGWTLDLLKDLAKGLLKKKIEEHTGISL